MAGLKVLVSMDRRWSATTQRQMEGPTPQEVTTNAVDDVVVEMGPLL